jgi:hypothetical protein
MFLRPQVPGGSALLEALTDAVGIGVCVLGQGLRLWAWGSNADVGKFGVRTRGPYVLMRHPLYTGNFLILCGLVVVFHNPWAYLLFLLPFAYLYHVITQMEEARMNRRFGADYHEYRGNDVPRFLPALRNFRVALKTTAPFGWGLAWRKEYESCCGWLAGVSIIAIYERVVAHGWVHYWSHTRNWLAFLGVVGMTTLGLWIWKTCTRTVKQ